jgi:Holliday junction resolvase RusA-like endonuclease
VADVITFTVPGIPQPQGSKKWVGRLIDSNADTLRPWRDRVLYAARDAMVKLDEATPVLAGAIAVGLTFRFVRPASVSARKRPHMTVKPDLDKLTRAIFDSCTDAGVWRDDAQVVTVVTTKTYGEVAGVHVSIEQIPDVLVEEVEP